SQRVDDAGPVADDGANFLSCRQRRAGVRQLVVRASAGGEQRLDAGGGLLEPGKDWREGFRAVHRIEARQSGRDLVLETGDTKLRILAGAGQQGASILRGGVDLVPCRSVGGHAAVEDRALLTENGGQGVEGVRGRGLSRRGKPRRVELEPFG